MAKQTTEAYYGDIRIELVTEGPESQEGHDIGSDVLHIQLREAVNGVLESRD